jgi:hypothetical protein
LQLKKRSVLQDVVGFTPSAIYLLGGMYTKLAIILKVKEKKPNGLTNIIFQKLPSEKEIKQKYIKVFTSWLLSHFNDHSVERNLEPSQQIETASVVRAETGFSAIDDVENSGQIVSGNVGNDDDRDFVRDRVKKKRPQKFE